MIRVLTLSSLFPDTSRPVFGSFVERQTLGLASHPDVELQVIAPIGIPPFPFNLHPKYTALRALPQQEIWKGLTVHRPRFAHVPSSQGRYDARNLARALKRTLTTVRRDFAFDVIDAEFFFPDGPAAIELGRAFGVPVSIKARGSDIHYWAKNPATAHQVVSAGQTANGLLAVSEAMKADMVALGMPEDRIRVHYTGVDMEHFQPLDRTRTKADLGVSGALVCSVGALIPLKGQAILIEALTKLPNVTLALIGKGEDEARLKQLATTLGAADRVIFTGPLPPEKVAIWLGAADVMALASEREGLANVWVEALASGTPVVTCDVGGAREVIGQSTVGQLADRNADAFADAIRSFLEKPPAQDQVRASVAGFTWARNTQTLLEHLSNLRTI